MFLQLSKNKSLLYVLSKVELDDETAELVRQEATATDIKKSLERNINSNNMISYRKYIQKAKDEVGSVSDSEEEDYVAPKDNIISLERDRERNIRSGENRDKLIQEQKEKRAFTEISVISDSIDDIENLLKNIKLSKEKGNLTATDWRKNYRTFGTNENRSERIINLMNSIKRQPQFLLNKNKDILQRGILTYNENEINVAELSKKVGEILNSTFDVEGTQYNAIEILVYCHTTVHGKEPASMVNRPQRKEEMLGAMFGTQGFDAGTEIDFRKYLPKFRTAIRNLNKIDSEKKLLEDRLKELKDISEDDEKIIANKIRRLQQGLNELINTKRSKTKNKDDKVKQLLAQLRDITDKNNQDKYIKEAKIDFMDKVEEETTKLNELIEKADFVSEAKPIIERLSSLLGKLDRESTVSKDVKKKITSAVVTGVRMAKTLNQLVKDFDKLEDKFRKGLKDYIESSGTVQLSSGFGSITFDETAMVSSDSMKFVNTYKELENKLNIIENMLE